MTDVVVNTERLDESSDGADRLRHAVTPAHDEAAVIGALFGTGDFFHRWHVALERED